MTPEELLKKQEEEATEKGEVKAPPKQIIVDMRGPQVPNSPAASCRVHFFLCACFLSGYTLPCCSSVVGVDGGVAYTCSRVASYRKMTARLGVLN